MLNELVLEAITKLNGYLGSNLPLWKSFVEIITMEDNGILLYWWQSYIKPQNYEMSQKNVVPYYL